MQSLIHTLPRNSSLSIWEDWPWMSAQLWRHSPGAEEGRGQHISWIVPTVSEGTDAMVQSGLTLENSLIQHRLLCSVQHHWAEKFHLHVTTHGAFWKNFMRSGVTQTQLHNWTLKQIYMSSHPCETCLFVSSGPSDLFSVSSRIDTSTSSKF